VKVERRPILGRRKWQIIGDFQRTILRFSGEFLGSLHDKLHPAHDNGNGVKMDAGVEKSSETIAAQQR